MFSHPLVNLNTIVAKMVGVYSTQETKHYQLRHQPFWPPLYLLVLIICICMLGNCTAENENQLNFIPISAK